MHKCSTTHAQRMHKESVTAAIGEGLPCVGEFYYPLPLHGAPLAEATTKPPCLEEVVVDLQP